MKQLKLFEVRSDLFEKFTLRREKATAWYWLCPKTFSLAAKCKALIEMDREIMVYQHMFDSAKKDAL
ncbi:hypothetical protein NCTGTJJY_CDS0085 [Serratia phage 92A1]|nr:hypothetical protein NCTGTJJY_CDS0085 [Serratia phage 92A1]